MVQHYFPKEIYVHCQKVLQNIQMPGRLINSLFSIIWPQVNILSVQDLPSMK